MSQKLHILVQGGVVFAGVEADGRFTDIAVERHSSPSRIGEVLRGRVARVDVGAGFAFVDLGRARSAFMPLRERGRKANDGRPISPGDELLVQVVRDAVGPKLEEVTRDIGLAGRYLVFRPFGKGNHASGLLSREAVKRLAVIVGEADGMGGWIFRRAAAKAEDSEIWEERRRLETLARSLAGASGSTLIPAPGLLGRMLADFPSVDEVVTANAAAAAWTRPNLSALLDAVVPPVVTRPSDLAELVERAREPVLELPGGGSIRIERTSALTTVDVDTGRSSDPLSTNLEAAVAVASEIRLRNIGGILIVDFVSMGRGWDQARVAECMRSALVGDPARISTDGRLSLLGLFEFARERRGLGLMDLAEAEGR